jgi:hypothetical protein
VTRTHKKRAAGGGGVLALTVAAGAGYAFVAGQETGRDPADLIADHAPADGAPLPANQFLDGEEPTDVATDPEVTVGPAQGARLQLSYAAWDDAAGGVSVDGFVPSVVESTGTCTLVLTKDGTTVTTSVPGTPSVSTTSCGGAVVPGSELSPGTWTAVLSYESPTSSASAEPVEVTVP